MLPGEPVGYRVEIRNQGNEPIRDWRLKVNAVAAPSRYVSRIRDAQDVGEVDIPRLEPGERRVLDVEVAPPAPGSWMLLFDARDSKGTRAAELGSPVLQVRLDVAEPVPTSEPAASPSPMPEAD